MGDEHGTPPTPDEEAVLLGEEIKLPPVPGSSPKPVEQCITPTASSPSPIPQSNCCPSLKAKESWKGIDADPNNSSRWVCLYIQENDKSTGMVERIPIAHLLPGQKASATSWSKEWPASKLQSSGYQPHNWNKMAHVPHHPA